MKPVYFLLPAYNEEENLPALFHAIAQAAHEYQIILINDGSTDTTGDIAHEHAKRMPVTVLNHEANQGLGAALKTGISYIVGNGSDGSAVVTMDSDLTHDPALVPDMVSELSKGYDVVVRSRYVPGGQQLNLPFHRRILGRAINILLRLRGSSARDSTSGFRCISIEALRRSVEMFGDSFITTVEFTSTAQILMRLQAAGARIKELPVSLDYRRKMGLSKMNIPRTIRAYIRYLQQS
ncbi:MAG: glycosyltransferase family 2 protein [Candidatus Hermodarchaeota archaeon]